MKKLSKIIMMIITLVVALTGIKANAESTITIDKKTYIYTDNRSEAKFHTDKGYAYCITPQSTGPSQGTTLKYKSKQTSGGVLYLLENAGTSDSEYLATQLAIWQYDSNYMPDFYLNHSSYAVVKRAKALAAKAEQNSNYQSKAPSVNLTASSSTLVETSDGNYYKSGVITLKSSNANSVSLAIESAPAGTQLVNANNQVVSTITSNGKFYVRIPADNTATATVNLKATAVGTVSRVERYTTGNSKWQELVVLVKVKKTVNSSTKLTVSPVKRYCAIANGRYYGKDGSKVSKEEYEKQCVHKCEIIGGKYYGKDGKETDKTNYSIQCEKHSCELVGNTYFGKDGSVITKEQYSIQCEKHSCEKVGNSYFGRNGTVVSAEQYDLECNVHKCEKVGDKYFGTNGTEVDEKTYNKQCFKHTCEVIDDTYYGKDGTEVDYSEYTIQCEKHTCEYINGKYFGTEGTEITEDEYINQCVHTCEIYNNQYYGSNGTIVTLEEYKAQCEAQVVPVPDTGSMSDMISILIGSSILGAVIGALSHKTKRTHA